MRKGEAVGMGQRMRQSAVRSLIEIYEPYLKRKIRLGKFDVTLSGEPCYTVDLIGDHDRMEKLDAWGICPAVMDKMAELGINLIVVYDRSEDATYTTTREEVLRYGILRSFKPRGAYYHLSLSRWRREPGKAFDFRWTNRVIELQWAEPGQLSLL